MSFNTLATGIYANSAAALPSGRESGQSTASDVFRKEAERFWSEAAEKANGFSPDSGKRTVLTDAEIAVLQNKYDVRNMSDAEYSAFLDELEGMGAITREEKELLGCGSNAAAACISEDGQVAYRALDIVSVWSWSGSPRPAFHREETDGDILKWVADRLKWKAEGKTPAQIRTQAAETDTLENLSKILARMTGTLPATRQRDGEKKEDAEPDLIDQLADPGSAFYQDMFQRIRLQMEMSDEEKKEQAIIDALDSILEGMRSSDRPDKRTDMTTSMANLSKEISQLDKKDPRRAQLDLFRQRLNHLGIYMDLGESIFGGSGKNDGLTLTQQLIREKTKGFDPSAFDLY